MPQLVFDDANGTNSLTAEGDLVSIRMAGFNSMVVQVTEPGDTGCTIVYETSNDNNNWAECSGISVGFTGVETPITFSQEQGMWSFPKTGRYFRARVAAYSSGTVTIYWVQSQQPVFIIA